jgi:hypothetical protein
MNADLEVIGVGLGVLVFGSVTLLMWVRLMLVWALDIGKILRKFGRGRRGS